MIRGLDRLLLGLPIRRWIEILLSLEYLFRERHPPLHLLLLNQLLLLLHPLNLLLLLDVVLPLALSGVLSNMSVALFTHLSPYWHAAHLRAPAGAVAGPLLR